MCGIYRLIYITVRLFINTLIIIVVIIMIIIGIILFLCVTQTDCLGHRVLSNSVIATK